MPFPIINRRFTPVEFATYVAGVKLTSAFQPTHVVIHNTGIPTLAQRPNGWTPEAIKGLYTYYDKTKEWTGGPHAFMDDKEDGIVGFNLLNDTGVHSPSWNKNAWGLEMLGDYDGTDDPLTGRGAKVVRNTVYAAAILLNKIGAVASDTTIRFHKEDKATDHDCPGRLVIKADFVAMVKAVQDDMKAEAAGLPTAPSPEIHHLHLSGVDIGTTWANNADGGRNYFPMRLLLNKLHGAEVVKARLAPSAIGATWDGVVITCPMLLREGATWVQLAAFAKWQNLSLERDPATKIISLKRSGK